MLDGAKVLLVEDDPATALMVESIIAEAHGEVAASCRTLGEARGFIGTGAGVDCALLDVHLPEGHSTPLLEALRHRNIPTVIYTGGGGLPEHVRTRHPDCKVLAKPVLPARLIAELRRAIAAA